MEALVVVLIVAARGLVPLALFRWPFWAALACIAADGFDTVIQDALGVHPLEAHYHNIDKGFDLYYLAIEAAVAGLRWPERLARFAAYALFLLRVVAVVGFEVTGARWFLFAVGPNVFENFYIFVSGMLAIDAAYRIRSGWRLATILVFVGAPKVLQEYVMHYREAATWDFVRENVLLWR